MIHPVVDAKNLKKKTYLIIPSWAEHSTSDSVRMSLEYGYRMVILFSEVPKSEGGIFGGCHYQSGCGVSGRVGQLLVVT